MALSTGVLFFSTLSFETGFSGIIVETHPFFWVLIATSIFFAFKIRKENFFGALFLIYIVGLGVRMLVAFHSLYPGSGPWNELGAVNHIRSYGFDLKGNYYHSGMPVLQSLINILGAIAGDYVSIVYIIPILAWTSSYIILFFFCRAYMPSENTLIALLLFSTANLLFQSTIRAEIIAVPLGMVIVYIIFRKTLLLSNKDLLLTIGLYALLIFTHHLTSGVLMLILASLVFVEKIFHHNTHRNFTIFFAISAIMFFSYWELFQGLLSEKLAEITLSEAILPVVWQKPVWWWFLYLLPKVYSAGLVIYFIIHVFFSVIRDPVKDRFMSISSMGALVNVPSFFFPGGYLFLRVFHQFFRYHTIGISYLPRSKILLKILAVTFLIGLVTEFPIIDRDKNSLIGGYWFDHSYHEVEAVKFLATQTPNRSRIVIDLRVEPLIYTLGPIPRARMKIEPAVYRFNSTEEAWNYCIKRNYHYIFISNFYKIMFISEKGAEKFTEGQLNKFTEPYFIEIFRNEEVTVYEVNGSYGKTGL